MDLWYMHYRIHTNSPLTKYSTQHHQSPVITGLFSPIRIYRVNKTKPRMREHFKKEIPMQYELLLNEQQLNEGKNEK